jgi:hypothetical protein
MKTSDVATAKPPGHLLSLGIMRTLVDKCQSDPGVTGRNATGVIAAVAIIDHNPHKLAAGPRVRCGQEPRNTRIDTEKMRGKEEGGEPRNTRKSRNGKTRYL